MLGFGVPQYNVSTPPFSTLVYWACYMFYKDTNVLWLVGDVMLVIPAVDIKDGKCVRLFKGRKEDVTVYYENPVDVAKLWADSGAKRIHVVDLDGAFEGLPVNLRIIEKIASSVSVPVEAGGGVRNLETVKALLDAGVSYVIMGTVIVEDYDTFCEAVYSYPGKVIAGIDGAKGQVVVRGWEKQEPLKVVDLARKVSELPIESIIFTEITKDGTLSGIERRLTREVAEVSNVPVIASGGVATLEDIRAVKALEPFGVKGVIVGKALYEKRFTLEEALRVAQDVG